MLFQPQDLANFLRTNVDESAAITAERVVWGWLRPVLGLTERPYPVPDEVFSWALELGAIAHENPAGLSYYQLGAERSGFSSERRAEILTDAGGSAGGSAALSAPMGAFPTAEGWPDPPRVHWSV